MITIEEPSKLTIGELMCHLLLIDPSTPVSLLIRECVEDDESYFSVLIGGIEQEDGRVFLKEK